MLIFELMLASGSLFPSVLDSVDAKLIFQEDGAPQHHAASARTILDKTQVNCWAGS